MKTLQMEMARNEDNGELSMERNASEAAFKAYLTQTLGMLCILMAMQLPYCLLLLLAAACCCCLLLLLAAAACCCCLLLLLPMYVPVQ
jgi:hypothetical protein